MVPVLPSGHEGVICKLCCVKDFAGTRFKCLWCNDHDLCGRCNDAMVRCKDKQHPMQAVLLTSDVIEMKPYDGVDDDIGFDSYQCPLCYDVMGLTKQDLYDHFCTLHKTAQDLICPVCLTRNTHSLYLDHILHLHLEPAAELAHMKLALKFQRSSRTLRANVDGSTSPSVADIMPNKTVHSTTHPPPKLAGVPCGQMKMEYLFPYGVPYTGELYYPAEPRHMYPDHMYGNGYVLSPKTEDSESWDSDDSDREVELIRRWSWIKSLNAFRNSQPGLIEAQSYFELPPHNKKVEDNDGTLNATYLGAFDDKSDSELIDKSVDDDVTQEEDSDWDSPNTNAQAPKPKPQSLIDKMFATARRVRECSSEDIELRQAFVNEIMFTPIEPASVPNPQYIHRKVRVPAVMNNALNKVHFASVDNLYETVSNHGGTLAPSNQRGVQVSLGLIVGGRVALHQSDPRPKTPRLRGKGRRQRLVPSFNNNDTKAPNNNLPLFSQK